MKESELRTVHLISGRGSTLLRIVHESKNGRLKGKINPVLVISNNSKSPAIQELRDLGIRVEVVKRGSNSKEKFGEDIIKIIREVGGDILFQNGWLAYTPENIVNEFPETIFNQHPGPLDNCNIDVNGNFLHFGGPGMYGLRVHAAVIKFQELSGRKFPTEATIHIVTPQYDGGKVVARDEVKVFGNDTPQTLAYRVIPIEHETHIAFLGKLYDGDVRILERRDSLIKKGEENMLYEAKKYAISNY